MDQDGSLNITYDEWRDYLLYAPTTDIRGLITYWRHSTVSFYFQILLLFLYHLIFFHNQIRIYFYFAISVLLKFTLCTIVLFLLNMNYLVLRLPIDGDPATYLPIAFFMDNLYWKTFQTVPGVRKMWSDRPQGGGGGFLNVRLL